MYDFEPIRPELEAVCRRYGVTRLSAFGSALREDFDGDSDVDLLFDVPTTSAFGLFKHIELRAEFESVLGRPIDLVAERAVNHSRNLVRKESILSHTKLLYAV